MIDLMRGVHGAYAPASEPFGTRLETFFIALCVALGHMDGKPFSVAKIAAYMRVPRSTVIRRLDRLQRWGLIYRQGRRYYMHDKALNSFIGMRSYEHAPASEQGHRGIDHFGHFAGLTLRANEAIHLIIGGRSRS